MALSSKEDAPGLEALADRAVVGEAMVLIEDDREDAVLVQVLLEEASEAGEHPGVSCIVWATTLGDALPHLKLGPACVLLDVGLPDAVGADAITKVVESAPESAVVVLTGHEDDRAGLEAIAGGAQDYLVKGSADGITLSRAVRYAIERKRAANLAQRLQEVEIRTQENVRLERGLLPRPLLRSDSVRCMTLYRPGGDQALLGGDFFDVVELDDGFVRAMIGDVSGHGPDEAALGVRLRVAWRTLVLAGVPPEQTFETLQELFRSERTSSEVFVTLCDISLSPAHDSIRVLLAGHPAPILVNGTETGYLAAKAGPPVGVVETARWPVNDFLLESGWSLFLFTDGLVENVAGRLSDGTLRRLDSDGLLALVRDAVSEGRPIERIVQESLATLQAGGSGEMSDDVAIVALSTRDAEE